MLIFTISLTGVLIFVFTNWLVPYRNELRYIPAVKVTVSTDGGKTYKEQNKKSIPGPDGYPFYVKFTITVKSRGMLWSMMDTVIPVYISYSGTPNVTLDDSNVLFKDTNCSADDPNRKYEFSIVASAKSKPAEIIFCCCKKSDVTTDRHKLKFDVWFDSIVNKSYRNTITLRTM
jgi:hypothetical protein